MQYRCRITMNFVIEILKVFGTKNQKITAIQYDNETLYNDVKALASTLDKVNDNERLFTINKIEYMKSLIEKNERKLARLKIGS